MICDSCFRSELELETQQLIDNLPDKKHYSIFKRYKIKECNYFEVRKLILLVQEQLEKENGYYDIFLNIIHALVAVFTGLMVSVFAYITISEEFKKYFVFLICAVGLVYFLTFNTKRHTKKLQLLSIKLDEYSKLIEEKKP